MEFNADNRIIQNIFRSYFTPTRIRQLPLKDIKAAEAIMHCRTMAQGYTCLSCPEGHEEKIQIHSCRHRSCPLCADKARHQWIEKEKARLLDCAHYHVVFTLPHEYLTLWQYNREWFTKTYFKVCRDTLMELLNDARYLGATPGILMTLHTWGRQLNYHPHMHCLVTAGGVTKAAEWKPLEGGFLLPISVVKSLYRGKFQASLHAALKTGALTLPPQIPQSKMMICHRTLYKKEWSVRIQEKYDHGKGVALYLARYMKGGPLNPKQIIRCGERVDFRYKDHRDQRIKMLSLRMDEFIRRLLWHVPVVGAHVVRHFGLYASKCRDMRNRCRERVGGVKEMAATAGQAAKDTLDWCCEICGKNLRRVFSTYPSKRNENSFIESANLRHVQQSVKTDITNVARIRGPCTVPT